MDTKKTYIVQNGRFVEVILDPDEKEIQKWKDEVKKEIHKYDNILEPENV